MDALYWLWDLFTRAVEWNVGHWYFAIPIFIGVVAGLHFATKEYE